MKPERLAEIREKYERYLSLCAIIRAKDKQNQDPLSEQMEVVRIQNESEAFVGELLAHVRQLQDRLDDAEAWMGRFARDSEQYRQGREDANAEAARIVGDVLWEAMMKRSYDFDHLSDTWKELTRVVSDALTATKDPIVPVPSQAGGGP